MKAIILQLKAIGKWQETQLLIFSSLLCFGISIFRMQMAHNGSYFFLNWNLFLAFIPWFISTLVLVYPRLQNRRLTNTIILGSWLLFFPNAPYILTDLFHLRYINSMPVWFDLTLILLFAWTGLLFGFISLRNVEKILSFKYSQKWAQAITIFLLFLAAFGVYLGRFLRWNSWDILQAPQELMYDIFHRFAHPMEHPRTWGMTLFFGLFLNLVYWSLKHLKGDSYKIK